VRRTHHEVALDPLVVENEPRVKASQALQQLFALCLTVTSDHVKELPGALVSLGTGHERPLGVGRAALVDALPCLALPSAVLALRLSHTMHELSPSDSVF